MLLNCLTHLQPPAPPLCQLPVARHVKCIHEWVDCISATASGNIGAACHAMQATWLSVSIYPTQRGVGESATNEEAEADTARARVAQG